MPVRFLLSLSLPQTWAARAQIRARGFLFKIHDKYYFLCLSFSLDQELRGYLFRRCALVITSVKSFILESRALFRLRIVQLFSNGVLFFCEIKTLICVADAFRGSWIRFCSLASTDANSHCSSNVFLWCTDNRPVPTRHFVCFPFILLNSSSFVPGDVH